MLLAFGARNFYCFKEGIEVSFRLGTNCPNSISKGNSYSNIIAVKGANASGKTNVLKVLPFLSGFCCDSFANKPDAEMPFYNFFDNAEPSDFFVEFSSNGVEYKYEASLTRERVVSEAIFRKDKRLSRVVFREGNKLSVCIKEFSELEVIKLRSNASLISTAKQYEISCLSDVYSFFQKVISNVHLFGLRNDLPHHQKVSQWFHDNDELFLFVKKIICKCDLGIMDIVIRSREGEGGEKIYFPIFYHDVAGENDWLTFHEQSSGTKSLFCQLWRYKVVLDSGGILVHDEFDINLHSHILPVLLELFENDEINKTGAQLLFTTHDTAILDYLGKYRTVLCGKDHSESFVYRLDEVPGDIVRNDRPLSPVYSSGKLGGVPRL